MLLVLGSYVFLLFGWAQKIEVPYIPFTGRMFLDFLVIALLDQNIQNWNKMSGHKGR